MLSDENEINLPPPEPPPIEQPLWGIGAAIFGYFGFLVIQVLPALIIVGSYSFWVASKGGSIPKTEADYPAAIILSASMVSQLLTALWVIALIRFVHGMPVKRGIAWDGARSIPAWKAAAAGLALMMFNGALSAWMLPPEGLKIPLMEITKSNTGLAMFGFMAIFIAPISEELLFRGYIFAPLEKRLGAIAAIAVTTLLFMAPHLLQLGEYWQGVLLIGLLGAATGALRAQTGGIRAGVICHFVYNSFLVLAEIINRLTPD